MKTFLVLLSLTTAVQATTLPGFSVQTIAKTAGFADSIAVDSLGTIYYTTTAGGLYRLDDVGQSTLLARVNTVAIGNSGLLGMALRDDHTAVVHYTTPNQVADVISLIDLHSGAETVLHSFNADIDLPSRGSPAEHHGGNPSVAADGSIFVGIGDYGGGLVAALLDWNGGKIWRVFPDGSAQQFARGFRNPFEVSWDAGNQRLIAPDNGVAVDDEINIVHLGDDAGWPFTMGNGPVIDGTLRPSYVFPTIVAPTGFIPLSGRNPILQHGYLLGAFVTRAIYYINDIDHIDPIALVKGESGPVVDVAEGPNGEIYFCSGTVIYELVVPRRGDCNGDGLVNANDILALQSQLAGGATGQTITSLQSGATWGCDADGDGILDDNDVRALLSMIRGRAVR